MDCMRSFIIGVRNSATYTGASVKTWAVGVQNFWVCEVIGSSVFDIQGFKNIDIYGVKMTGDVQTTTAAATGGVVIEDFAFDIFVNGQIPLVSGATNPVPNFFNLETTVPGTTRFRLSRNCSEIFFKDPIKSTKFIEFQSLHAQGVGAQTLGTISLDNDLTFVFYYKYEGE